MKKFLLINVLALILGVGNYAYATSNTIDKAEMDSEKISSSEFNLEITVIPTNIDCAGNDNGAIDVTVTGGNPPYTYLWNTGATTASLSGLVEGTYSVTVTDSDGATETTETMITSNALPVISSSNNTTPSGGAGTDGMINITVEGAAPFTYLWNNGATTQNISNLPISCNTVTVTDANGCSAVTTYCIGFPLKLTTSSTPSTGCSNADAGTANVNLSGGIPPYTYLWSNGGNTQMITGLNAGTYTVTVTDSDSQTASSTTIVTGSGSSISVSATGSMVCGNDTAATANATGGNSDYTYAWSNGENTQTITGLSAGTYSVTVTDSGGCTGVAETEITATSPPVISSSNNTNPSGGLANGMINITVEGAAPFTFLWNTGATTQNISDLLSECYTVTVTDVNDCSSVATYCIGDPDDPLKLTTSTTPTDGCVANSSTGTATVNTGGGTPPYTYLWSNGGTTKTITDLSAGTYIVTVTDSDGITQSTSATVGTTPAPSVEVTGVNTTCENNNGVATANVTGGVPGYTYAWSTGATTQSIDGLSAGTYTAIITDSNGCTATDEVTITTTGLPDITSINGMNPSASGASDGSISITVDGASPFTYSWSNGATTQNISGLSAGCYTVTVTDANTCTATATTCIGNDLMVTTTSTPTDGCIANSTTGTATANPSGGTPPYTYLWNNGEMTQMITGLEAGDYTVTVTDTDGQTATSTTTVGTTSPTSVVATGTNTTCGNNNGSASADASGGVPDYTYEWSNGAITQSINGLSNGTYTVTATDSNGCTATTQVEVIENSPAVTVTTTGADPNDGGMNGFVTATVEGGSPEFMYLWSNGGTTQTINNLGPGCYTVTVTDSNQCTDESTFCLAVPFTTVPSSTPDPCTIGDDGTASVEVIGGVGPFTYLWSNGETTQTISGLPAGTYTVVVTDVSNDETSEQTIVVGQETGPDATAVATNISCFGDGDGSVEVSVAGGNADDYTYLWSTSDMDETASVMGLPSGTYSVTVTDESGCTDVATTVIEEDDPIEISELIVPVNCIEQNSASIEVTATGGTGDYIYQWSTASTDPIIEGLGAGVYTVMVTDANGCTQEAEYLITEPEPVEVDLGDDLVSCDGSATISVITSMDNMITWTNADGEVIGSDPTIDIVGEVGDNWIYAMVENADGCEGLDSLNLFVPEPIVLELTPQDSVIECEQTMLQLTANDPNVSSYTWYSDSELTNEIGTGSELPAFPSVAPQFYYVVAVNEYDCEVVDSVFTGHTEILSALEDEVVVCIGDMLTLVPGAASTDANAVITYTWTNASGMMLGMDSTLNVDDPSNGTYFVEMTDQYGCTTRDSSLVSLFDLAPLLSATADEDTILKGMESQLIALPSEDGYGYEWSNSSTITQGSAGDSEIMVAPEEDTNYQVRVTSPNGCSALTNVLVTVVDPLCAEPFIFFPNAFSPNDDGVNDVLYLRGFNVDEVYFMIFNRWGQKVFESNNQSVGWDGVFDGEKVCNDVYGFYLRVKCSNGQEYIKKGNVTVFN